jgi:hypothetical protein
MKSRSATKPNQVAEQNEWLERRQHQPQRAQLSGFGRELSLSHCQEKLKVSF